MRLTIEELQAINDGIQDYLNAIYGMKLGDTHFPVIMSTAYNNRFFELALIVDIYKKDITYQIVNVCEVDQDDYLDAYNQTFKK